MEITRTQAYEGLGNDASDLVKIMMWADNDHRKLGRLYLRYPRAKRITVPMVERFLQEELDAWADLYHHDELVVG